MLAYEGPESFPDGDVYVVDRKAGTALCLSPLYLWGLEAMATRLNEPDLFEFDTSRKEEFLFRSVQSGSVVAVDAAGDFKQVHVGLSRMREREQARPRSSGLSLGAKDEQL